MPVRQLVHWFSLGAVLAAGLAAPARATADAAEDSGPGGAGGVEIRLFELGRDQGLPSVQVHAVAEDSQGLLWFATPAGLGRFDGHRVTTYGQRDGLTTQGLRSIAATRENGLWIGSDVGVEMRAGDGRFTSVASSAARGTGIVQALAVASDGTLWIAAARGLRRLLPGGSVEIADGFRGDEFVVSLAVDRAGRPWFVTLESGLHRLAPDGEPLPPPSLPALGVIRSVAPTDAGGVLIAGELGVAELAGDDSIVRILRTDPSRRAFRSLLVSGEELWLGGERGLYLYRARAGGWALESELLEGLAVNQLALDASGNVWIATNSRGVFMASAARAAVQALHLPCSTQVYSLTADGDDVLIGSLCSARLRASDGAIEPLAGFAEIEVWDLLRRADGTLFAATARGLLVQEPGSAPEPFENGPALLARPMRALLTKGDRLWAAGVAGLARVELGPRQRAGAPPRTASARELLDPDGGSLRYVYTLAPYGDRILAGTLGRGLWDVTDEPARRLPIEGLRDAGHVYAIDCHRVHGCVIVEDERLLRIEGGRAVPLAPPSDDAIAGWTVRFDGAGDLWVGGPSGLTRYRLPDREPQLRITPSLGLPGYEFSTSRSLLPRADGTLLCGLDDGLARVASAAIERLRTPPAVGLLETRWSNARFAAGGPGTDQAARVRYGRWSLELLLYSPWHVDLTGLRFRHRLLGLDERWSELDPAATALRYSALPPGAYALEAQATSPLTGAGPARTLLEFTVDEPWWLSAWFLVVWSAALLALGVGAWSLRNRALSRRARQLEQLVEERTLSLAEANAVLEELAHHDSLTSLPNRRLLQQRAAELCAAARRGAGEFGLALVDLDHFKRINDELGHDAGDEALRQLTARLAHQIRGGDLLARLSGEEFVVLFRRAPTTDLATACERLREAAAEAPFALGIGTERTITISVGWTAWRSGDNLDSLLKRADDALYRAKRTRNAVAGDPETSIGIL